MVTKTIPAFSSSVFAVVSTTAGSLFWGMLEAMACIDLIGEVKKVPFWKREKFWKENYEQQVLEEIINPIEKNLEEMENG